ncbi:hypothetical protein ASE08_15515 [Rhizobacter sp. Root16D2]|nr:hypothetical protein ASE08_15515 [Rhizobacter sp. Root16D2]
MVLLTLAKYVDQGANARGRAFVDELLDGPIGGCERPQAEVPGAVPRVVNAAAMMLRCDLRA